MHQNSTFLLFHNGQIQRDLLKQKLQYEEQINIKLNKNIFPLFGSCQYKINKLHQCLMKQKLLGAGYS